MKEGGCLQVTRGRGVQAEPGGQMGQHSPCGPTETLGEKWRFPGGWEEDGAGWMMGWGRIWLCGLRVLGWSPSSLRLPGGPTRACDF